MLIPENVFDVVIFLILLLATEAVKDGSETIVSVSSIRSM